MGGAGRYAPAIRAACRRCGVVANRAHAAVQRACERVSPGLGGLIARKLRIAGRQGMTTRPAQRAAASAALSECGAVSIIASFAPDLATVSSTWARPGGLRRCDRRRIRRSNLAPYRCAALGIEVNHGCDFPVPPRSAATARCSASVVFPDPPFCEMTATVFISSHNWLGAVASNSGRW